VELRDAPPAPVSIVGRSSDVAGHPEVSWSIILDAGLREPVHPDAVRARLVAAWPRDGSAGGVPSVVSTGAEHDRMVAEAADLPYGEAEPSCRLFVRAGPTPRVAVAAHHAALDGLGLVAVLGVATGQALGTSARGAGAPSPAGGWGYAARRLGEALFRPPARIGPRGGAPGAGGDHLVRADVSRPVRTIELIAAAAHAAGIWNAPSSGRRRAAPIVVAVGAARGTPSAPIIGTQAAWFRIPVTDPDPERIRVAMRRRGPEPRGPFGALSAARLVGLSRALSGRTGSTLLVSHLGGLMSAGSVRCAVFYPAAHGRSGICVGGITVDGTTTLGLRARRAAFSRASAGDFLATVKSFLDLTEADGAT
jgi:hypothetical protein